MKTIALKRLNLLGMPKGEGLTSEQKITLIVELSKMGYSISNPEKLNEISATFFLDYKHLMKSLSELRGGDVKYVPLFKKFPQDIPDDGFHLFKRILGYIGNQFNLYTDVVKLDNGMKVPKSLFNVYDFGADPITQNQSKELHDLAVQENKNKKSDSHVEWIDLKVVSEDELIKELKVYLHKILYSKSSIKEELHQDIFELLDFFGAEGIDSQLVTFKETKALLLKYFWEKEDEKAVKKFAFTATDILRMFACITETDISLATKIKFPKMNRKQRKCVLSIMEKSASLAEDIKKYKGLWLEIGRYLHPTEYAKKFPKTAQVFDALRNGKIETFASQTERFLNEKDLKKLLNHLEHKQGVYARKLHEVLRRFPFDTNLILASFQKDILNMPLKNLMVLKSYFETINQAELRTVVNKKGKMKVLLNNAYEAVKEETIVKVVDLLDTAITMHLSERDSQLGQKVWIDPNLINYTVPLQQRKASDGIITVGRGSRIDINFDKVLRLFVYWKEKQYCTDLDLSVIQLGDDFEYLGHVSYTQLKDQGIAHSGDITSAPLGAAEFIDITLNAIKKDVRYLTVQVYKYSGHNFVDMDCHAGWMIREDVNPDIKTFDIKTVANKFDLNGTGAYAIPLMVDIQSQQVIITDLFVSGLREFNNVEGAYGTISMLCKQVNQFTKTKPNLWELAIYHTLSREAELVENKEDADISYGYSDCTYNATDVETILSELI